jgi:hypothetical protein
MEGNHDEFVRMAIAEAPGPLLWVHNRTQLDYRTCRDAITRLLAGGVIEVCGHTRGETGSEPWYRIVGDTRRSWND